MALRLQIVSRHRQTLGERGSKEFGHSGGTIGRSLESDWVLPDSQRYLSSRHASIDYRSGSYYIVDTSTNGVYVNDAEQPVGRGNPQRLFSGDRIRIGEYEMHVEIDEDEDANLGDSRHVDPVAKAQRVPPPDPTRADLIPAHEITAVGIEMLIDEETELGDLHRAARASADSLRLEDDPAPVVAVARGEPPPVSAAARVGAKASAAAPPKPATPTAPRPGPAPGAAVTASAGLDAFFRGAGLPERKLDARQAEHLLKLLGQLMREVVLGLSENLQVRAEQKQALRLPTTTIQPQNNNPLKFSASVEEALDNLLLKQSNEYLASVEAVRETFADIKRHQQLVLAALRTAIVDYVGRLDPDELENKVNNGKRGGLMSAANKLKYWDLYKDLYQLVAQTEPGHFPPQFIEELTRAYELEDSRNGVAKAARPAARAS